MLRYYLAQRQLLWFLLNIHCCHMKKNILTLIFFFESSLVVRTFFVELLRLWGITNSISIFQYVFKQLNDNSSLPCGMQGNNLNALTHSEILNINLNSGTVPFSGWSFNIRGLIVLDSSLYYKLYNSTLIYNSTILSFCRTNRGNPISQLLDAEVTVFYFMKYSVR